jgi:predicted RNase H-like HicB family nuclease
MEYIAFIHKENGDYVATVPDLNYTSSYGSTFKDAVHNIMEAAELYCEDLAELPRASSLEKLETGADIEEGATPQLIDVKVEKNVRVNIMMRSDLLKAIDEKAAQTHKGNRSAYLQDLARNDIAAV